MRTAALPPRAGVFLLELVFSGREGRANELPAPERRLLLRRGLVVLQRRGRAEVLVPTAEAWSWVSQHLELDPGRARATGALKAVLSRLHAYLHSEGVSLTDFVWPPAATRGAPVGFHRDPGDERALSEQVRAACLSLAGGKASWPVRLAAVRAALAWVPRGELDEELVELQREGVVELSALGRQAELTVQDELDALVLAGVPRHVVLVR